LKELRGTAHILLPGDEVSIPSKLSRKAEVPGGTAEYVVQSAAEVLRLRFAGLTSTEDDPVTFKATPDTGDAIEGTLSDDGRLDIDLPPDTSKVQVELSRKADDADADDAAGEDDAQGGDDAADEEAKTFATYDFTVGGLDPGSEVSGVQARLLNLGFYDGDITGALDDDTREAITHFRWAKLRDHKDTLDDDFLAALNKAHGS
jgi:Putative peptidoglycan binding domain